MDQQYICKKCKNLVSETAYFCPNCGTKLREKPLSTSFLAQSGVYALSILAPPFGLIPGIKYLRQPDQKSKIIGTLAIVLTIIMTVLSVWLTINYLNNLNKQINQEFAPFNSYY